MGIDPDWCVAFDDIAGHSNIRIIISGWGDDERNSSAFTGDVAEEDIEKAL